MNSFVPPQPGRSYADVLQNRSRATQTNPNGMHMPPSAIGGVPAIQPINSLDAVGSGQKQSKRSRRRQNQREAAALRTNATAMQSSTGVGMGAHQSEYTQKINFF